MGKKKIMIVDDEPGVLYTIKHGLESLDAGYEVIPVESGKQCLEMLEQDTIPDLIILDIMMPEMNGWEVHKKLKNQVQWRTIPVIFLTAATDTTSKRIGSIIGDDYIQKPFDVPDLKKRIEKVLK